MMVVRAQYYVIKVEHRALGTFFVIQHELHGDPCAAGPPRMARVLAITGTVARVRVGGVRQAAFLVALRGGAQFWTRFVAHVLSGHLKGSFIGVHRHQPV